MLASKENLLFRRWIPALAMLWMVIFCPGLFAQQKTSRLIYRNPRVYNVDFTFELSPDPEKINRAKDLRLWIPVPRDWDSQRAVKILSVQPPPRATFKDPDYGNRMFFWDFGKGPERATYRVNMRFRLESFEVHAEVDPQQVGPYDKSSREYRLYTRSGHTVAITPKLRELARQAVGSETNPYLQAERILRFVAKKIRYEITFARGIPYLLSSPARDEKSGEEYYIGDCTQYAALFVAMCRAVGIPARCVYGFVGWRPWVKAEELKNYSKMDTQLSPIGTAGAENRLALSPHMWAEFYLPKIGWIPADANANMFGTIGNWAIIMSKGRDIQIGPHAPHGNDGYGFQWVLLSHGRVDGFLVGVWNIARIRKAKTILVHSADPFPAGALAEYESQLYPSQGSEKRIRNWRKAMTSQAYAAVRGRADASEALAEIFRKKPQARYDRQEYVCHLLRHIVGDEKFSSIVKRYQDLRLSSGQPVPTAEFEHIAEDSYGAPLKWFFNQWSNGTGLPRLALDGVTAYRDAEGWQVRGKLIQTGATTFHLPVQLALETKKGEVRRVVWLDSSSAGFEFRTPNQPMRLLADPGYDIPTVRRMPVRLSMLWDDYPNLTVIYGTVQDADANKVAAERFTRFVRLGKEIIKADSAATAQDLKSKCLILVGRPAANRVAQRLKDSFHIRFQEKAFAWKGVTYDQPGEGVVEAVKNPRNPEGLIILYAGLSKNSTLHVCDSHLYGLPASYLIFEGNKPLAYGDWELHNDKMVWKFDE